MADRTPVERLTDQFLLLYLISDVSKRTPFVPETKIQKLTFISEREMLWNAEKGFNYYFIKLLYGPYSTQLDNDLNSLVQAVIVKAEPTGRGVDIAPTQKSANILRDFNDLIRRNQIFVRRISDINRRYGILGFKRLLNSVYHMQTPLHKYRKGRRPPTIASLPLRTPLLKPISEEMASKTFSITPEEVEDLVMNFSPKTVKELSQAMKEMRAGVLRTHEQVFSNL